MSNRIKMFTRLGLSVLNNNIKKPIISSGTKTLYTASGLGIDEYKITRERVLVKYGSGADGFRKKMSDINTPESFEYGLNIYREIINKGNTPLKKIVSAIGALSLNQKAPHITLEILSQFSNQNYISVKSLRLIALAELGRLENIFVEFKFILQHEAKNNQLYKDVIPKIQETFKNGNLEPNPELLQLLEKLQFGGYISDLTLDEHLTMPIELQPKDKKKSRLLKSQLADYDDESDNWGPKSYIKHNN
ncbi:uncharacterized protein [Chelonus insularis]|uniref:uncharacterized protein isoform X2 n=1 Tax=Chelonus insularis TaxID=460826 RepID=UPI001589F48C|nr:uncharacterized protein LOC118073759 isoform X2 [Chelonus insularis]